MSWIRKLVFVTAAALLAHSAHGAVLLSVSFSKNFPFGPFAPNEAIEVVTSVTNISPDQTITICEGVCIGDEFTYSLGGLASNPSGYSFYFGNLPVEPVFDGQIAGALLPGQEKDFVFGVYTPTAPASPGHYGFVLQLQIFAATVERPMLTASTFSGNWEVQEPRRVPEPATASLLGLALAACLAFSRKRAAGSTHMP